MSTATVKLVSPGEPEVTPALALSMAFVDALGEMTNPGRDATARVQTKQGGTYTYGYATLDAVLALVRPVLARHGLALSQTVEALPTGQVTVRTKVMHRRGATLEASPLSRIIDGGPQDIGSFVTYARRYAVLALLGLHPEGEDDDGAQAQRSVPRRGRQQSGAAGPASGRSPGPDVPAAPEPPPVDGEAEGLGEGPDAPPPPARNPIATSGKYKGFRFAVISRNPEGRKWLLDPKGGQADANGDVAAQWAVWGEAKGDEYPQ